MADSASSLSPLAPGVSSVTITAGQNITFKANGLDTDLSGAEWYGPGDGPYVQYVSTVGGTGSGAIFSRTYSFAAAGQYSVSVQAFDTSSAYSGTVTWTIIVNERERALYVDHFNTILGNRVKEDNLLEFSKTHGFTELTLYNLHTIFPDPSYLNPAMVANLKSFISKAKRDYAIQKIGGAGSLESQFESIINYNTLSNTADEKIDSIVSECEYWNTAETEDCGFSGMSTRAEKWSRFLELLNYMKSMANPHDLETATYLGWSSTDEAIAISTLVDTVYLHCYVGSATQAYGYCKDRMKDFAGAKPYIQIRPIFSSEWRAPEMYFMGQWFENNSIAEAETIFANSLNDEQEDWADSLNLDGFQYFAFSHLSQFIANAPILEINSPPSAAVTIDQGQSIVLKADGSDSNGNLSGAEWFGPGDSPYLQSVSTAGGTGASAVFSRAYSFATAGQYSISVRAFDTTGAQSGAVTWTVDVQSAGLLSPEVSTESATNISQAGATLNATVNANGVSTLLSFDYGTTTVYGSSTLASDMGSGVSNIAGSIDISGLACGSTYHFRAKAVSGAGTSYGTDSVLTTSACQAAVPGDLDSNGIVNLADEILCLRIITSNQPTSSISLAGDINNDGAIGLAEAIYILQKIAGLLP